MIWKQMCIVAVILFTLANVYLIQEPISYAQQNMPLITSYLIMTTGTSWDGTKQNFCSWGEWIPSEKTCLLVSDVNEPIIISNENGVTLDGNGYAVSHLYNTAIEIIESSNIVIQNVNVKDSAIGIQLILSEQVTIRDSQINNNNYGIILVDSIHNIISDNKIFGNHVTGTTVSENSVRNTFSNNLSWNNEKELESDSSQQFLIESRDDSKIQNLYIIHTIDRHEDVSIIYVSLIVLIVVIIFVVGFIAYANNTQSPEMDEYYRTHGRGYHPEEH